MVRRPLRCDHVCGLPTSHIVRSSCGRATTGRVSQKSHGTCDAPLSPGCHACAARAWSARRRRGGRPCDPVLAIQCSTRTKEERSLLSTQTGPNRPSPSIRCCRRAFRPGPAGMSTDMSRGSACSEPSGCRAHPSHSGCRSSEPLPSAPPGVGTGITTVAAAARSTGIPALPPGAQRLPATVAGMRLRHADSSGRPRAGFPPHTHGGTAPPCPSATPARTVEHQGEGARTTRRILALQDTVSRRRALRARLRRPRE